MEYSESKEKLKNQRSSRNQNSRSNRPPRQGARLQGAHSFSLPSFIQCLERLAHLGSHSYLCYAGLPWSRAWEVDSCAMECICWGRAEAVEGEGGQRCGFRRGLVSADPKGRAGAWITPQSLSPLEAEEAALTLCQSAMDHEQLQVIHVEQSPLTTRMQLWAIGIQHSGRGVPCTSAVYPNSPHTMRERQWPEKKSGRWLQKKEKRIQKTEKKKKISILNFFKV